MMNRIQEGILSRNVLSRKVYANWSGFLSSKNCLLSKKKPLTIYKRHQIVITEPEKGAVGTDFFEADVTVGTRRPKKGQNMQINEKHAPV
jgi:hypothetical protein